MPSTLQAPSRDSQGPRRQSDDSAQLRAIIARLTKEREIYFAAIQSCGGQCKTYCIEHVEEKK